MSVREFVARIWPHCRTRKGAVAMILVGCAIEVAFFWVVPLSFRSLIDNAIGPRDRRHLVSILAVLAVGIIVSSIVRADERTAEFMRDLKGAGVRLSAALR
jgi:Na+(H+)/acetate symporter ActP